MQGYYVRDAYTYYARTTKIICLLCVRNLIIHADTAGINSRTRAYDLELMLLSLSYHVGPWSGLKEK